MSPALYELRQGSLPVIISFPHSGVFVPQDIAARLTSAGRSLPDTDWFVPELYRSCLQHLDVSTLIATHSRYVVDLNRPADGAPLYPGRIESAVCPTETFEGAMLYNPGQELDAAEVPGRIEHFWRPYHAALAAECDRILTRHGRCLVWDAHSIRSRSPRLFDGSLPDLNLGSFSGRSAHPGSIARITALLSAQGQFSCVVDGRFKGGYITRHFGQPAHGVEALQLEIAQCAYMSEEGPPRFDPGQAAPLAELIRQLIAALI